MKSLLITYAEFLKSLDCASRRHLAEKIEKGLVAPADKEDWRETMESYFPSENLHAFSVESNIVILSGDRQVLVDLDLIGDYFKSA
jgi:hypothetical protein